MSLVLYRTGREAIADLMDIGAHVVILSGGYGLVQATEPIGRYNTVLKPCWWPNRLLERVLIAYATHHGLSSVRAFASATSADRQVLERAPWSAEGIDDSILTLPEARPGGMVRSPQAIGEALIACRDGTLTAGWHSSSGLGLSVLRS